MALIKHQQFKTKLPEIIKSDQPQCFLIYGESYLTGQVMKVLPGILMGEDTDASAVEPMEGGSVTVGDISEQISTLSFFSSKKLVWVKNAPLFQTQVKSGEINFTSNDLELLGQTIEKGFAPSHFLVLTCRSADKRKKIFKTIEKTGVVIDCSVAAGVRKADLDAQRQILSNVAEQILSKNTKTIEPRAFTELIERIGFDLDGLSLSIEKLSAYSGTRSSIIYDDVTAVVKRVKKDPIFNLTNAYLDKNIEQVLFYLSSLLLEGYHPLQIIKAFENQIRKLLMFKSFVASQKKSFGISGTGTVPFHTFKQTILPEIVRQDQKTRALVDEMNFQETPESKKKKAPVPDLFLAPNPKNAYPVYQTFLKSKNFSLTELQQSLAYLSDLDLKLKSSAVDARSAIEFFLMNTCSKGGFTDAAQD